MFDKFSNKVFSEQKIIKFEINKGGAIDGKSECTVLYAVDAEHAFLRTTTIDGNGCDEKVTERPADIQSLVAVKDIFLKYEMYRWGSRTFSFKFSADRPTICYCFTFERETVQFSSQFFPKQYAAKLAELEDVIAKCQIE